LQYCEKTNSGEDKKERTQMNTMLLELYVRVQAMMSCDEGQDLVEYALVVAIIALGATAAMGNLAGAISTSFGTISSTFANAL
jgi:pilus assembly protein Flp/PilA